MSLLVYLVTRCVWWFSSVCLMFVRDLCTRVMPLAVTGCVSAPPVRLCARVFYALFNGNGYDKHSRKYRSIFARWFSRLEGFTLTVKLTGNARSSGLVTQIHLVLCFLVEGGVCGQDLLYLPSHLLRLLPPICL